MYVPDSVKGTLSMQLFCTLSLFFSMTGLAKSNEQTLIQAAEKIDISIRVDHNYLSKGCPNNAGSCYQASMTLRLPEAMPDNWRIQFSHLSPIVEPKSNAFSLNHINGDLHEIRPTKKSYKAGDEYQITFFGFTPLVSESVLFPNYLLIDKSGKAQVIASTTERLLPGHQVKRPQHVAPFENTHQLKRRADDLVKIANPKERYSRYVKQVPVHSDSDSDLPNSNVHRIIPKIQQSAPNGQLKKLQNGIALPVKDEKSATPNLLSKASIKAIERRLKSSGIAVGESGETINFRFSSELASEAYRLEITDSQISLISSDSAGTFYGLMSLAQLYDKPTNSLPQGSFDDSPAMAFRGLHIDVARNFRSKDFILATLDQMAYYKLNKLHFHLADDEAWRLEIPSLPELTAVGSNRCFDEAELDCLSPQLAGGDGMLPSALANSGYYSAKDYIDILRFAEARQIEVIPSLDMPGHSRAAIKSMEARFHRLMQADKQEEAQEFLLTEFEDESQYRSIQHYSDNTLNPCIDSTYRFVDEVISQLKMLHSKSNVPLIRYHIGADETAGAWTKSPACMAFMAKQLKLQSPAELGPYFVERVANRVLEKGLIPAAWSDGLLHANPANLPKQVQANAWETLYSGGHNKAHKMINNNWDVVLSTPDVLYFDFPYEAHPHEPGYYWGSRFTDTFQVFQFMPFNLPAHAEIWQDNFGHNYTATAELDIADNKRIKGIQAQLWGETVRSDSQANYMLFPRLLAVAERAWHTPKWVEAYKKGRSFDANSGHIDAQQINDMLADWQSFSFTMVTKAMPSLIEEGVIPRVPLPGAQVSGNTIKMKSPFQGLVLEYKVGDQDWAVYAPNTPLPDEIAIRVRSRIPDTSITSREITLQVEDK